MALLYAKAMSKYRFKTEEEFKEDDLWNYNIKAPNGWNDEKAMDKYLGQDVPDEFIDKIEKNKSFNFDSWHFEPDQCIINSLSDQEVNEILNQVKHNSLITKNKMKTATKKAVVNTPGAEKFVFMDKTVNVLNVGYSTCKNVVLYGPGE